MPLTVTWDDGVGQATSFEVPDDVLQSLDQFRRTITSFQPPAGYVPMYADVKAMIVGIFVQSVVMPALAQFPTAAIGTALANLEAAKQALAAAQAGVLPGFTL